MSKGILKFLMLKIISEEKITGYGIIKRVEDHTGNKPSTGSVYPMLKSMENEGWISGEKVDDKTFYEITDSGRDKIKEFDKVHNDFIKKIHQSVVMVNETFEKGGHLVYMESIGILVHPLVEDVVKLLKDGVDPVKISGIISKARDELKKLWAG